MAKDQERKFNWSTLVTTSLLVGFVGFGLGFNWDKITSQIARYRGQSTASLTENLDFSSVEELYDTLRKNFGGGTLDANALLEGAKQGLVKAAGDPYTEYLSEKEAQELEDSLNGTFSGVGAEIAVKNDRLVVVAPIDDSPAARAGLKPGDYIAAINGESTEDMSVETAVSKIRGEAGSQVTLTIIRGNDAPKELTITRAVIEVPSVKAEMKTSDIGYIELSRFGNDTAERLRSAAVQLKAQGAKKIILDVRNNPGGLLNSAVNISDEFMNEGVIVEEKRDGEVIQTERAQAGGLLVGLPTVVLINEGSASASEIIAGALQDNKRATLVGKKTFGKGSVQEIIKVNGRSVLKVTVALWYTPNGRNITKEGIEPDIKVDLTDEDFNNNRDPQLQKAIEILSQQ